MGLREFYKIFFAIPFDADTMSIYKNVIAKIQEKYEERKLNCVSGNMQIGTSPKYSDIETFKMQNSELFKHFVKQIRDADIVIADLTDNNPNVHVELGIALFYNKNILRVTRQSYEKIPFDVRNYECSQYKRQDDLFSAINEYLTHFFKIKDLDFEEINSSLYYHMPEQKVLGGWKNDIEKEKAKNIVVSNNTEFQMRDGKIRVTIKIEDQIKDQDWFGVFLRAGDMGPLYGSCLVYIRKNGNIEIATYPGPNIVRSAQLRPGNMSGDKTLTIEIEGGMIKASIDDINLKYSRLNIQPRGYVIFGCYQTRAKFSNVQIVCRDTIEAFDMFEKE